ncbi:unnamed protein product [Microthlaspi erraticum]|uniref:Uncharacterized protein n=1 Tax=Microthlaspi erraticum TaxID=1685480 RepID=A0A6D2HQP7_9BRAS|nr:unnamed protein product [Microthlaspi erraticum]
MPLSNGIPMYYWHLSLNFCMRPKLFVLNHMMDFMGFEYITRADIFTTMVAARLPSKASSYELTTNELKLDEYIVEALGMMCEELFHKPNGYGDASLVIAFGILETWP